MTARQSNSAPDQTRFRTVLISLIALFVVGFLVLRGFGAEDDGPDDTVPSAGATTITVGETDQTEGPGSTVEGTTGTTQGESTDTTSNLPSLQTLELRVIFEGFRQPTVITAPEGDDRLFVVQRVGVIRILDENLEMVDPAFLDISDRVLANGIEQGLLGMAFHPAYEDNGRFFVYYTDRDGRRQLSEFTVSVSDPNRASGDSERVLFEFDQPEDATDIRHYGGQLMFGPDGYLWVSLGDGADSRDQGQDPNTMFGTVSRIDVDGGDPYAIPPENPFVDGGGRGEVWAYGLRNPWRFAIDPVDRLIYIADVGHADQEEINVLPIDEGGFNLGWSDMEGTRCFHEQDCDPANYTSPVLTYSHNADEGGGCSVTGGHVYRGSEIPELHGTYFYSDWCSQWIRSFKYVNGQVTEDSDWTEELGTIGQINAFGFGGDGELYAVTHAGAVAKFVAVR